MLYLLTFIAGWGVFLLFVKAYKVKYLRFMVVGLFVGGVIGTNIGIAGSGTAVNGMLIIAFLGQLIGFVLAPARHSSHPKIDEE